jgi:HPt (histidine-containing phosphotransfer) domain-containing protein
MFATRILYEEMTMNIEDLAAYGANVDEGLARCLNNEEFYLRLVNTVKDDPGFEALDEALQANDLDKAFEAAHSLKGSLGNLSITPLLEPVVEMTELLRARTEMDYSDLMAQVKEQREKLLAL